MKRDWFYVFMCVVVIVGIAAAVIGIYVYERDKAQAECRSRGGTVVKVHSVRDEGWFCQERQP